MLLQTIRAFSDESSYIKSFWIEGWGNRNIDNDMCAKMLIFIYIRKLNNCVCMPFIQINYQQWMFDIYSQFRLCSNFFVTKNRQFHVSQSWHGTGPILPLVVLALYYARIYLATCIRGYTGVHKIYTPFFPIMSSV